MHIDIRKLDGHAWVMKNKKVSVKHGRSHLPQHRQHRLTAMVVVELLQAEYVFFVDNMDDVGDQLLQEVLDLLVNLPGTDQTRNSEGGMGSSLTFADTILPILCEKRLLMISSTAVSMAVAPKTEANGKSGIQIYRHP